MGLFSGSRKVYVSSSIYNMTEPESGDRVSFIREALTSTVLSGDPNRFLGESLLESHLKGPRTAQRSFFRWAKNNYDLAMPRASIDYGANINNAELEALIHATDFAGDPNVVVSVSISFLDGADESFYAERYILENKPELIHVEWLADYDFSTNDITIQYPTGTEYPAGTPINSDSFFVPGYSASSEVIVAYYQSVESTTALETEEVVNTSEAPNAPIISVSTTSEVSGTAQPNSSIELTVGSVTSTEAVNAAGAWSKNGTYNSSDGVEAVVTYAGKSSSQASTTIGQKLSPHRN